MLEVKKLYAEKQSGINGQQLKIIAIVAMFIDHAAGLFIGNYYSPLGMALHFVGRITAPIMFYLLVEGYHHTRNKNKYTLRLFIFAVISYLPFVYFHSETLLNTIPPADAFLSQSVIFTLFLALLMLRALHEIANPIVKCVVIVLLILVSPLGDWGYTGMFMVLVFDLLRGDFNKQAIGYSVIVGIMLMDVISGWVKMVGTESFSVDAIMAQSGYVFVQLGMFLPLILLKQYNGQIGKGGKFSKWIFYIFYPFHLVVLLLLKQFLG